MSADRTPPAPRARRAGLAALVVAGVLVLGASMVMAVLARGITAPDWVRARIETRLNEALPGLDATFDEMRLQVAYPGRARVGLRGVRLVTEGGVTVADLADVGLGLAPRALARGQVALDDVRVNGAFVTLVRQPDGRLGLALGSAFGGGPVPSLTDIIASVDRALAGPNLSGLDRIEAEGLTLRYEDRRAGRGWTLDGGRLRIAREDGRLDLFADLALLGGGDGVSTVELTAESVIGSDTLAFGVLLDNLPARDIATQSPALAWLEALDAPISGALRSGVQADGTLRRMDATLQIGAGALAPNPATRPIPFDGARTYFSYLPAQRLLRFDEIAVQSPLGEVLAEGQARLDAAENGGLPRGLWAQMRLSRITLSGGTVFDRAVTVDGAQAAFQLSLDPFRVTLGSLRVTDPAFPLRASGTLVARPEGWDISLDAHAVRSNAEQVLSLWPGGLGPRARAWVSDHVGSGRLRDATFAIRAVPGAKPVTYLDTRFADADVAYNRRLPAITGGAGRLTIDGPRLALRLDGGTVDAGGGPIDVAGSGFVIPDLGDRGGPGVVSLAAKGSAAAVLSYLDNPEWRLLEKAGRGPDMAQGTAEIAGTITLPLRKGIKRDDVALDLSGTLRDVESDRLVEGRTLTAKALPFSVDAEGIIVEGPVRLSGVAADARWHQPMGGGGAEITADVTLSPAALDAFGIALPEGMLSGSGQANLSVALRPGAPPAFKLDSDLAGLALDLPQLGWGLRPGTTGRFAISGTAGPNPTIDALSLRGPGLTAEGTLMLAPGDGLKSLALSRLAVGGWLDTDATVVMRDGAMDVALRGGTLDLRRAPFGQRGAGGGAGGAQVRFDVALDTLRVTDTITLDRFEGRAESVPGGGLRGGFTARVGGEEPVQGELLPRNGGVALRLAGEDAGDILQAAGLLSNVQDGTFRLDLAPVPGAQGQYDGLLTIEGARLQDTPTAAALLDAISVVGLIDQLNGPGIYFSEVEARFRLTPDHVILSRGSAVGPSMGISMDGYYGLADGRMDLQGVLSPVYILNGIGRLIARKGEGLIGFNFNLRGTRDAPQVTVNPLSVFTPGMFRDIFRRPPPTLTR